MSIDKEDCCSRRLFPLTSAIDSAKKLIESKGQKVTEEIYQERIRLCNNCPELRTSIRQCKVCLCFIDLKAKFEKMNCPLQKW